MDEDALLRPFRRVPSEPAASFSELLYDVPPGPAYLELVTSSPVWPRKPIQARCLYYQLLDAGRLVGPEAFTSEEAFRRYHAYRMMSLPCDLMGGKDCLEAYIETEKRIFARWRRRQDVPGQVNSAEVAAHPPARTAISSPIVRPLGPPPPATASPSEVEPHAHDAVPAQQGPLGENEPLETATLGDLAVSTIFPAHAASSRTSTAVSQPDPPYHHRWGPLAAERDELPRSGALKAVFYAAPSTRIFRATRFRETLRAIPVDRDDPVLQWRARMHNAGPPLPRSRPPSPSYSGTYESAVSSAAGTRIGNGLRRSGSPDSVAATVASSDWAEDTVDGSS